METVVPSSPDKRRIRMGLLDLIYATRPKKVFCLCGIGGGISKFLPPGVEIVIAERDRRVYKKISNRYPRFRCYNELASVVLEREREFEFAWLDFCGPYSNEVIKSIRNLDMVNNGFMGITLMRNRYHREFDLEVLLKKLKYQIVDTVLYQSGSPMVFYLCLKQVKLIANGKKGEKVEVGRT